MISVFLSVLAGVSVYAHDLIAKNNAPHMRSAIILSEVEVDICRNVLNTDIGSGACWFGGESSSIYLFSCLSSRRLSWPFWWRIGSSYPFSVKVEDILKISEQTVVPLSSWRVVLPAKLCRRQCAKPLKTSICFWRLIPQRNMSRSHLVVKTTHFLKLLCIFSDLFLVIPSSESAFPARIEWSRKFPVVVEQFLVLLVAVDLSNSSVFC